jgi:hypothetical protein
VDGAAHGPAPERGTSAAVVVPAPARLTRGPPPRQSRRWRSERRTGTVTPGGWLGTPGHEAPRGADSRQTTLDLGGRVMATDLTIYVEDQPTELARLSEVLGGAGINIEGFCAVTSGGGQAELHVLVEDAADALTALAAADLEVTFEQEVAVLALEDRPGALGDVTRRLGDAGINLTLAYLATNTRLVFAADNLDEARGVLDESERRWS